MSSLLRTALVLVMAGWVALLGAGPAAADDGLVEVFVVTEASQTLPSIAASTLGDQRRARETGGQNQSQNQNQDPVSRTAVTFPLAAALAVVAAVFLALITVLIVSRRQVTALARRVARAITEPGRRRRRLAARRALGARFAADGEALLVDLSRLDGVLSVTGDRAVARDVVQHLLGEVARLRPGTPVLMLPATDGPAPLVLAGGLEHVPPMVTPPPRTASESPGPLRGAAVRGPVRGLIVLAGEPDEQQRAARRERRRRMDRPGLRRRRGERALAPARCRRRFAGDSRARCGPHRPRLTQAFRRTLRA
ncbi:hypothetical protein [Actinoplanes sp. NPDC020271]|uniref:hypothetical protein n=1 Tax=Actinoplanes sp. NPDC020271 TaxID=3363896 RepID=UPI003791D462